MIQLPKNALLLFVSVLLIIIVLFYGAILIFQGNPGSSLQAFPSPTPIDESKLPKATQQIFYKTNARDSGTLIVTANTNNVTVTVDEPVAAEAPTTPKGESNAVPKQQAPFTMQNIPAGNHILRASKTGYLSKEIPVLISANQTARITINLEEEKK